MREAMYGWMRRWLAGEGDGSPIPEPPLKPEDPAAIRCFAPGFRPSRIMTSVQWVSQRSRELAEAVPLPAGPSAWAEQRRRMQRRLREVLRLGSERARVEPGEEPGRFWLLPEAGVRIPVFVKKPPVAVDRQPHRVALLLSPAGAVGVLDSPVGQSLRAAGVTTIAVELRGCGQLTVPNQGLGAGLPDHNLVEWSLLVGRPLLGQWVLDVRQALATLAKLIGEKGSRTVLVGWREAGLAAIVASALSEEVIGAAAIESLATFRSDGVPHAQRMVVFSPDLLQVGDIPHLAALAAPRPVLLANPLRPEGSPLTAGDSAGIDGWSRSLYRMLGREREFQVTTGLTDARVAEIALRWLDGAEGERRTD
jgi:hypothetical protein